VTTGVRPDRSMPGPAGLDRLRTLALAHRDRLALMSALARGYGDEVRFAVGPKVLLFFNHPAHARHLLTDNPGNYVKGIGLAQARRALGDGLLTSEGDLWRRQREVVRPTFAREHAAAAATVIAQQAAGMLAGWRSRAGGTFDLVPEMTRLTLGVLGRAILGAHLGGRDGIGAAFAAVQHQAMFEMMTQNLVPRWVPLPAQRRFRRARRLLERMVDDLVADRRGADPAGADQVGADPGGAEGDLLARLTRPDAPPEPTVHDQLITLLLAGHETTACALAWTWHLVAPRPEVQRRLREEATAVLGDRPPGAGDLPHLRYAGAVVREAMRLYPPVWLLSRRALGDDEIGGYAVPAGSDVLICPYTLHRHPDFWPDPDGFRPERFDQADGGDQHPYAYLPFGAGPRFCVGRNLGVLEAVLVVSMIAREFTLRPAGAAPVVPDPLLTLRPRHGLPVVCEPVD
jgi:enediyne biosynthesis protein E7